MSLFAICYVLYAICYLLSIIKQAPAFSGGKSNLCAITSKNRITNIFASQRYKTNPAPSKQFPNFFQKKSRLLPYTPILSRQSRLIISCYHLWNTSNPTYFIHKKASIRSEKLIGSIHSHPTTPKQYLIHVALSFATHLPNKTASSCCAQKCSNAQGSCGNSNAHILSFFVKISTPVTLPSPLKTATVKQLSP